jgi:hypothetical protein
MLNGRQQAAATRPTAKGKRQKSKGKWPTLQHFHKENRGTHGWKNAEFAWALTVFVSCLS